MIVDMEVIKRRERIFKHSKLLRKIAEKDRKRQEYAKRLLAKF